MLGYVQGRRAPAFLPCWRGFELGASGCPLCDTGCWGQVGPFVHVPQQGSSAGVGWMVSFLLGQETCRLCSAAALTAVSPGPGLATPAEHWERWSASPSKLQASPFQGRRSSSLETLPPPPPNAIPATEDLLKWSSSRNRGPQVPLPTPLPNKPGLQNFWAVRTCGKRRLTHPWGKAPFKDN